MIRSKPCSHTGCGSRSEEGRRRGCPCISARDSTRHRWLHAFGYVSRKLCFEVSRSVVVIDSGNHLTQLTDADSCYKRRPSPQLTRSPRIMVGIFFCALFLFFQKAHSGSAIPDFSHNDEVIPGDGDIDNSQGRLRSPRIAVRFTAPPYCQDPDVPRVCCRGPAERRVSPSTLGRLPGS